MKLPTAPSAHGYKDGRANRDKRFPAGKADGLPPKNLIGIPWRTALALQADGWILRSDIIWEKPNCMPEQVTDRPTNSHEHMFLFAKSRKYYYDAQAIAVPRTESSIARARRGCADSNKWAKGFHGETGQTLSRTRSNDKDRPVDDTRNKRTVWAIPTTSCREAHFAAFPPKLVEPCILAGCPKGGVVLDIFSGSGTTGMVALQHGRNFLGFDLNPDYCKIANERIAAVLTAVPVKEAREGQMSLLTKPLTMF